MFTLLRSKESSKLRRLPEAVNSWLACAVANGGKHHLGRTFKRGRIGVDSDDGPGVFELRSHRQARWKEVFDQDGRFDAKQVICEERDTKWIRRITSSLR
jgi:hypothetical protein